MQHRQIFRLMIKKNKKSKISICRSLVTKLDAANHFTVSHLEDAANWAVVEAAQTVYSAGFFLTVSVDSMIKVGYSCTG